MDMRISFTTPSNNGCGSVVNFIVEVRKNDNSLITSRNVDYVNGQLTPYVVDFNDLIYNQNGNVFVRMITVDTNISVNRNGINSSQYFTAVGIPIFKDTTINDTRTLLTFETITQSSLASSFGLLTIVNDIISMTPLSLSNDSIGVVITRTTLAGGEIKYSITVDPSALGVTYTNFPGVFAILISNANGVQQHQF